MRPSHGSFHCFGCAERGDVIAFLQKIEDIGFVEAVERLADRVGVQLTYEGGGPGHQRDRGTTTRLLEANKRAAEFYAAQLRTPEAAPAWRSSPRAGSTRPRPSASAAATPPRGWDTLTKHLLAAGFTLEELMKAGLPGRAAGGPIDRFHRRLLWPIRDLGGEVVGFGARRIFDDDRIEAKYLNTPETPVYRKTHVLFGLDLAKREIVKRRQVVVVEGYTDVMAMHLAGVPTAVASCGTAFGAEHIGVIRRLLMGDDSFDRGEVDLHLRRRRGGPGGRAQGVRGDQTLRRPDLRRASRPTGRTPASCGRSTGDTAVRDLVARREPLFEFAIRSILRELRPRHRRGPGRRAAATVPLVARIKREELRDEYARRLAGLGGMARRGRGGAAGRGG